MAKKVEIPFIGLGCQRKEKEVMGETVRHPGKQMHEAWLGSKFKRMKRKALPGNKCIEDKS